MVAAGEIGIALGLGQSPTPGSVLYVFYSGPNTNPVSLSQDDIDGIRAIYGDYSYIKVHVIVLVCR